MRLLQHELGVEQVALQDSGTSALRHALELVARERPGAPVAFPAYACYDLATAALGAQVPVVLYDLDPGTMGPDWSSLEQALAPGAAAVVAVHLYGIPVDMDRVRLAATSHGVPVIEDAAQAMGARWRGVPAGGLGDFGVLSFGRGKGWTGGAGGALLVRQADPSVSAGGGPLPAGWGGLTKTAVQWLLGRPGWYALPAALPFLGLGETHFREPHQVGPISRSAAGILAQTRALLDGEIAARRRNAARLRGLLRDVPGAVPVVPPAGSEPSWLRFPVVIAPGRRRASQKLLLRSGVVQGYPRALADLESWGSLVRNLREPFPASRELAARLLTLPTHSHLRDGDFESLRLALLDFLP